MKRVFKFSSVVFAAVAIAGFCYWSSSSRNADVELSELVEVADADAECYPFVGGAHGRCLPLSGECVFDTYRTDCDPYHW